MRGGVRIGVVALKPTGTPPRTIKGGTPQGCPLLPSFDCYFQQYAAFFAGEIRPLRQIVQREIAETG
jgi:hypothetical protein